jgi:hypothetical protein
MGQCRTRAAGFAEAQVKRPLQFGFSIRDGLREIRPYASPFDCHDWARDLPGIKPMQKLLIIIAAALATPVGAGLRDFVP